MNLIQTILQLIYVNFSETEETCLFEHTVKKKENVNVNALFIVEVHLAIKLVYRHSTVNKVKVTIQT